MEAFKHIARGRSKAAANMANPWWAICRRALCGKVILVAPFFTEAAADLYLANHRKQLGAAHVFVFDAPAGGEYAQLVAHIRLNNKHSQK